MAQPPSIKIIVLNFVVKKKRTIKLPGVSIFLRNLACFMVTVLIRCDFSAFSWWKNEILRLCNIMSHVVLHVLLGLPADKVRIMSHFRLVLYSGGRDAL